MSQDPSLSARWRRRAVLRAGLAATAAAPWPAALAAGPSVPRTPIARIEPVSETFFGTTVVDPYRWMENPKDKDWEPYVKGQADHARRVLDALPGRDTLQQRIQQLSGALEIVSAVQPAGPYVFIEKRPAGASNFRLYVRRGVRGTDRLLVNPEDRKQGDVTHAMNYWRASPDGRCRDSRSSRCHPR